MERIHDGPVDQDISRPMILASTTGQGTQQWDENHVPDVPMSPYSMGSYRLTFHTLLQDGEPD